MNEPPMDKGQRNREVTSAVFEAEIALDHAIAAYTRLHNAEMAITLAGYDHSEVEHRIAERGVAAAQLTLHVLRALRGPGR